MWEHGWFWGVFLVGGGREGYKWYDCFVAMDDGGYRGDVRVPFEAYASWHPANGQRASIRRDADGTITDFLIGERYMLKRGGAR